MRMVDRLMAAVLKSPPDEAQRLQAVIDAARRRDIERTEAARMAGCPVFDPILGRVVELPR